MLLTKESFPASELSESRVVCTTVVFVLGRALLRATPSSEPLRLFRTYRTYFVLLAQTKYYLDHATLVFMFTFITLKIRIAMSCNYNLKYWWYSAVVVFAQ